MGVYLVERYVPSMTQEEVAGAASRLPGADGDGVRHLWTVLVPDEDTCLSLFEATDVAAVVAVNEQAQFPVARIVEAAVVGR